MRWAVGVADRALSEQFRKLGAGFDDHEIVIYMRSGIRASGGNRPKRKVGKTMRRTPTLSKVLTYMCIGDSKKNMVPRPLMFLTAKKHFEKYRSKYRRYMQSGEKVGGIRMLNDVGKAAAEDVSKTMLNYPVQNNRPYTVDRKGFNSPYKWKGKMAKNVVYKTIKIKEHRIGEVMRVTGSDRLLKQFNSMSRRFQREIMRQGRA